MAINEWYWWPVIGVFNEIVMDPRSRKTMRKIILLPILNPSPFGMSASNELLTLS